MTEQPTSLKGWTRALQTVWQVSESKGETKQLVGGATCASAEAAKSRAASARERLPYLGSSFMSVCVRLQVEKWLVDVGGFEGI